MRILVLQPAGDGLKTPFAALDPARDPARFAPEHDWTTLMLRKACAVSQLLEASRSQFDLYVNLCDGAWEEDRPGIEVVQALERLGVAFTGAGSGFYDPSRLAMKMAAHSASVSVPGFVMAKQPRDVALALERLRFPLIVKHPQGYSSVGLTPESCVSDRASLERRVAHLVECHSGALIEEFIPGRELTVLVAEARPGRDTPLDFVPVEFVFPPGETFKHFDLKWRAFDELQTRVLAATELELELRARQAAAWVFDALGGSGYARCDFRVDERGELYFLEVNPNCGVFYSEGQYGSADIILANDPIGHRGFLLHLFDIALARKERAAKAWTVQFNPACGFGLVATRLIAAGEIAVRYEERSQRLVSREHVERFFRGRRREWFDRYAWPLSQNVFAIWSEDAEEWCPINHSCDPSTWLQGLDLAARRPIEPGEPLTVDYATFSGPEMTSFECRCAAANCRRVVTGSDALEPSIAQRFGEHVSDYVRAVQLGSTRVR